MKRGDVVKVVVGGDYGKPRPAIIIQSDLLDDSGSVIVCLGTSDIAKTASLRRITLQPTLENGLKCETQIMVEKLFTMPRAKVGGVIGQLDAVSLAHLNGLLVVILGLDLDR